jgi:hypothetical protein
VNTSIIFVLAALHFMNIMSDIFYYQGYTLYTQYFGIRIQFHQQLQWIKDPVYLGLSKRVALFEMDPHIACRALLADYFFVVACVAYFSALKVEEVHFPEMYINIYRSTRCHIPEDSIPLDICMPRTLEMADVVITIFNFSSL